MWQIGMRILPSTTMTGLVLKDRNDDVQGEESEHIQEKHVLY